MTDQGTANRRYSFTDKVAAAAAGVGEAIARTAGAAATLLTEHDLRKRGALAIQGGIQGGVRGIQHGLQTGVNGIKQGLQTVGQGPRQLQSVLQRLSQQIEEQRMLVLLQEQRDAPVDVQVGFQLYEDAPQELRSRLWMALLQHPELVARHQALLRAEEEQAAGAAEAAQAGAPPEGAAAAAPPAAAGQIEGSAPTEEAPTAGAEAAEPTHASAGPVADPLSGAPRSATFHPPGDEPGDEPGWEVVLEGGTSRRRQGQRLLAGASLQHHREPWSPSREAYRNDLMAAMAAVPWPAPAGHPPDCRYATLLQISIGQEEVDEVIARDIHRTFPEYPLFAFEQGQQALFRVLKAYSLHDLEVNYCQGMAFLAGLLLFFVGEEAAFQILCRLLCAGGPALRRLYLPGLDGLKAELRRFDLLLGSHLPNLRAHLEAHGAAPVLFASQWFLTAFSCPFPVSFACRLVDVMLAENSDAVLQRAALSVMAECEAELLLCEDFEELLTCLKVEPVQWPPHRLRRVLDAAVNSPVSAAELAAAAAAAAEDPHPLLPPGLSADEEGGGEGGGGVAASLEGIEEAVGGVDGAVLGQLSAAAAAPHVRGGRGGAALPRPPAVRAAAAAAADAEAGDGGDLDAELSMQREELDTAYVQLVLDLDHMWSGGEERAAGEAYEEALTGPAPPPPPPRGAGPAAPHEALPQDGETQR